MYTFTAVLFNPLLANDIWRSSGDAALGLNLALLSSCSQVMWRETEIMTHDMMEEGDDETI